MRLRTARQQVRFLPGAPLSCLRTYRNGLLFHDIVDRPAPTEAEVEAAGVKSQFAKQLAVGGDDAHLSTGDIRRTLRLRCLAPTRMWRSRPR